MPRNRDDCSIVMSRDEKGYDQEKSNQLVINDLIILLEEETSEENLHQNINKIRNVLEKNKNLLNYQHTKDNKLRSLLHIIKYNSELSYEIKQNVVNMIVDVGCKLFQFSSDITEICHALFFVAAKGDYERLKNIVQYFKTNDQVEKLHDTKEGDTVLSFMIKFGDHTQQNFLNSLEFLVNEKIDIQRVDYYKNNIREVIEKEKTFLGKLGQEYTLYLTNLNRIEEIIERHAITIDTVDNPVICKIRQKYQLFHSIIVKDPNFKTQLEHNLLLINSDDGENTLLQLAIIKNNIEITKLLLQEEANPNQIVKGRNEEVPLILAGKLNRDKIFKEILHNPRLEITNDMFGKCVSETKPKFLNYLLEYNTLDVNFEYKKKTPLYYAIIRKNKGIIQSLLQRGSSLTRKCLNNINPADLKEYLDSCIKFDSFKEHMEENDYKIFLVFDVFIKDLKATPATNQGMTTDNTDNDELLIETNKFETEIKTIREIGSIKRLKHLLEHPLIYIFILLKWYRVRYYYFAFAVMKIIFYATIVFFVNTPGLLNWFILIFVIIIQILIVYLNFLEFNTEYRRYTLHFILEILILLLLILICGLKFGPNIPDDINQVSAFIIIFISISMLLTLGYHIDLSKWMSMAKRVFKNFSILLLFFLVPILAFAIAFTLLLPFHNREAITAKENEDFKNIPRAIFRTFVMLGGDLGDKQFSLPGAYIMFFLFAIGMAIILMNFWTGVAVSDIKEIEEQSIVVAFNNVIVFVESVEKIYQFIEGSILQKMPIPWRIWIRKKLPVPFLKFKVKVEKKKKEKVSKFQYGIELNINAEKQFKRYFKSLKLENDIISKIKSLNDENELNIQNTLKNLLDQCNRIEQLLESKKLDLNQTCSCTKTSPKNVAKTATNVKNK